MAGWKDVKWRREPKTKGKSYHFEPTVCRCGRGYTPTNGRQKKCPTCRSNDDLAADIDFITRNDYA